MESQAEPGRLNPREMNPGEMPQIIRELTMFKGATVSVHGRLNDLLGRLVDVLRDDPETPEVKLTEIPENFPVTTPLARELRDISNELGAIESKLNKAYLRLEL